MRRKTLVILFLLIVILLTTIASWMTSQSRSQGTDSDNPNMTEQPDNQSLQGAGNQDFVGIIPVIPASLGSLVPVAVGFGGLIIINYKAKRNSP